MAASRPGSGWMITRRRSPGSTSRRTYPARSSRSTMRVTAPVVPRPSRWPSSPAVSGPAWARTFRQRRLDQAGVLPNAPGGLLQRATIIAGSGWAVLLATRLPRRWKGPARA
jgi:hypothetical protein